MSSPSRCVVCGRLGELGTQYVKGQAVPVCRPHDSHELAAYWQAELTRARRRLRNAGA